MITSLQIRTARKMLNWTPDRLARRARVAVGLVMQGEQQSGPTLLAPGVARSLRQILEAEGLEFRDDPLRPVCWRRGYRLDALDRAPPP